MTILPLKVKPEHDNQKASLEKEKSKVLCIFSTDQMGIILRAFDELKVVKDRSMNKEFKTIVQYLSTPYNEELSYDAVHDKSYAVEGRDIKIVADTLHQIIEKIKRY